MRILFVIPYFYPAEFFGGPVKVSFDAGRELVRRGHEVVVYTSDAGDLWKRVDATTSEIEGMKVSYFRNLSMVLAKHSKLFVTPSLSRSLEAEIGSFDIIHAHEYTTYQNIILHKYAKKHGIPYVLQPHGSLPRTDKRLRKWIYDVAFGRRILADASKLIALTSVETQQCLDVGLPSDRIRIIPNGIDLSEFATLPKLGSFKEKYDIPQDSKIVLYLGRIHRTKRIDLLILAFADLARRKSINKLVLVIAGPDDGDLAHCSALARAIGIEERVIFTGQLSDHWKKSVLVDSDVFVTPSFSGSPITFLEACAVGIPVVTTTLGDNLDWVSGQVGAVVPPSPAALAKAIFDFATDRDLHSKASAYFRGLVQNQFTISHTVDGLERTYEEVLGELPLSRAQV